MSPPLLHLKSVRHGFGGKLLLDGAELTIGRGERLCLVGRNGSGKSTLLKIAAGLIEPENVDRFVQPGTTLRYLPQEPDLTGHATVMDYVLSGEGEAMDVHKAGLALNALGLTGSEDPTALSGGEARRAALVKVMVPEPDLLFLDEPTNHLDLPAIEWLEGALARIKSGLVLISHDRRFLEALSRATLWVDRGQVRRMEQGFSAFEGWRDALLEQEERDTQKLARQIHREEHWLRYGVTARRKRNVRRLDQLHTLRAALKNKQGPQGTVTLTVSEAEESGKLVIEAKTVSKSYEDRKLVRDFSLRVARGDRLGIVGANGTGKTTLVNLLTGILPPDEGVVRLAQSVELATLDQRREQVDPTFTLKQAMGDNRGDIIDVGGKPRHVMSYLKDFLFTPEQAGTPISVLSGGERGRMMLARALAKPSNLLVLDEPTNDLDLETLDLLQDMLAEYPGTLILVSHDRDFLDRVCTSVLMSEGNGRWQNYAGGYSDMLNQRGAGVEARAAAKTDKKAVKAEQPQEVAPASDKRKMTFNDRHQLETLPDLIEAMTRDIAKLELVLADPELYTRDRARHDKASQVLAELQAKRATSEDRLLELMLAAEEAEA